MRVMPFFPVTFAGIITIIARAVSTCTSHMEWNYYSTHGVHAIGIKTKRLQTRLRRNIRPGAESVLFHRSLLVYDAPRASTYKIYSVLKVVRRKKHTPIKIILVA